MIAICVIFLGVVLWQVARKRFLLRYILLWIFLALVGIIGAVFPGIVSFFSSVAHFQTSSNFIFFVAVVFLMAICLSLSAIVSKQAVRIKSLIQEVALIQNKLDQKSGKDV